MSGTNFPAVAEDVRQKISPVFSAFPPSMVVVCRGGMDAEERAMYTIT